ncbi:MAG: toxin-antitoxin system HicB family antitoxin [Bdellovibrionales bacterium]|nr:toxin-antitoxin system HicB family antitoxin [Bdellovibrionales bacterium]
MKKVKELVNKYSYHIEYNPEENIYIARCAELPDLMAHGNTQEKALKEIKIAVLGALKWIKKEKECLPEPLCLHKFSGQLRIRMSPEKHKKIAIESLLQGTSMNQFIINKL